MSERAHTARPVSDRAKAWILMRISNTRLLAPSLDLKTIESATDLDVDNPPELGIGWIPAFDGHWPAFALSDDLRLVEGATASPGQMIAVMNAPAGLFGLLCDEIRMMEEGGLGLVPLADTMRYPYSPIGSVAVLRDALYCGTDAEALAGHIQALRGPSFDDAFKGRDEA